MSRGSQWLDFRWRTPIRRRSWHRPRRRRRPGANLTKGKYMNYAIIGFGEIGQALAKAFARSGIEVSVATTRGPESFASASAAIGPEKIGRPSCRERGCQDV